MKARDIFLETIKPDGKPERMLKQYEALNIIKGDPLMKFIANGAGPGKTVVNSWGVTICWPEGEPGSTPVFDGNRKVLKDITHWQDYVKIPDLDANTGCDEDWTAIRNSFLELDPEGSKLLTAFMGTGIFEQVHFLMGFEDALTALYEHPDEMHTLIEAITNYRIRYAEILIDRLSPDAILSHDDWGTGNALFMNEDMWRDFFREPYRKFYGMIRSRGVITIHHADSYLSPIVEDMADIGIQVWQGTLPENDIPEIQARLNGRMTLMGGIGARIDRQDASEEEIRDYVKSALDRYCNGGHFIPCITYGINGTIFPHVDPIINDEIDRYNSIVHFPASRVKRARRVISDISSTESAFASREVKHDNSSGTNGIIEEIADTLLEGRKARIVRLVREAIDSGIKPETILSDGLIAGMGLVGNAFSEGEIFLPEMLMAAQTMTAATDVLKPLLVSSGSEHNLGKVAIGTVCGDLHDIGKNLCKLMLEGSGFEVLDLGSNVPNDAFINAVENENCNLICMSALLTTTMPEMKNVIDMLVERNLRSHVIVMVGGAPVNQEYADAIGADAYTADAGSAARTAVRLIQEKEM